MRPLNQTYSFSFQDYDLCLACYEKVKHEHKMEKWGLELDVGNNSSQSKNPQDAQKLSIQRCIQSLVHACQCRDANCRLPTCQRMKKVVLHAKVCKRKTHGECPICKQLITLCCYHAKHCNEQKCNVPFCKNIKNKLRQQQLQHRVQQAQMLKRRIEFMQRSGSSQPAASNTPSASPVSSKAAQSQAQSSEGAAAKAAAKPQQTTPPPRAVAAANQVQRVAAQQGTRNPTMAQPGGKPMSPSGQPRTPGGKPQNAVLGHALHMQQQPVPHFQKPIVTNQTGPGPGQRPANMQNPTNMDHWNRFPNQQGQMNASISNVQQAGIRQVNSLGQLNLPGMSHPQQAANSLGQQQVVQMQQQMNNRVQPDPALQQLLQLLRSSKQTQDHQKVSPISPSVSQSVICSI